MKIISKKSLVSLLVPLAMAGCNYDKKIDHLDVQRANETKLLGVNSLESISAWIQSQSDNWKLKQFSETPASLTGIDAVLINNNGQNDTADIHISGSGSHIFMLKSDPELDLSQYQSGYLQFKIRAKSALPSSIVVSIDNEWPNRSSLVVAKQLTGGGEWEKLAVRVACMKPFDGAKAVDLHSVKTPFHLDVQESFDYEITDVEYLLEAETNANIIGCGDEAGSTSVSVNQAPALQSSDVALYYSGDKTQATDYTSAYPVNSFSVDLQKNNQVIHVTTSDNGAAFLGMDKSNKDLSAYKDKFINIDLKVKSYGESSGLQVRMDGVKEENGKFLTLDNKILPADDAWYRCQLSIGDLIPLDNLAEVRKALYLSGAWNSMKDMDFSFANVAIRNEQDGYSPSSPCVKL